MPPKSRSAPTFSKVVNAKPKYKTTGCGARLGLLSGSPSPFASFGLPLVIVRLLDAEKDKKAIRERFYSIVAIVLFNNLIIASLH